MKIKVNINEQTSVELTSYGAAVLNDYNKFYGIGKYPYLPGDIFKTTLWEIMHIFGSKFHMGFNEMPFKNNEIEL